MLAAGLVAVLAFPPLTFLSGLVAYDRLGASGYVATLVGAALLIGALVTVVRARLGQRLLAPLAVVGATWLLMVVDGVLAGRLQFDTPFGYSPITAARFAGMGNLGFALLMVTAIVLATGAWPTWPGIGVQRRAPACPGTHRPARPCGRGVRPEPGGRRPALVRVRHRRRAGPPAALAVTWLLLAGVRVGAAKLAAVVGAAVVAAVAFAAYDLSRPEDRRTHLGRFARQLLDGNAGIIIERKLSSNLHVIANVGVILAATLAVVAAVAGLALGSFRRLRAGVPGVRAAVTGAIVGAVLGFGVNDSGVVVPGMMLAVLVPWFVLAAFELES